MTTCARPGCDDTIIPALDARYCSRMCRFEHLHPELAAAATRGTLEWNAWATKQLLPCNINSRCVCGDAA